MSTYFTRSRNAVATSRSDPSAVGSGLPNSSTTSRTPRVASASSVCRASRWSRIVRVIPAGKSISVTGVAFPALRKMESSDPGVVTGSGSTRMKYSEKFVCSGSASTPLHFTPAKSSHDAITWIDVDLPMRPVLCNAQIRVEVTAGAPGSSAVGTGSAEEGFLLMGSAGKLAR